MTTKKIEELLDQIEELQYENAQLKKCKRYGLVWEEKTEKFEKKSKNALPVLKEKGGKFKDIKDTKSPDDEYNILIEGDNYHSLSVLNYTHRNRIDVIYIDPPYNTGNKDFIYNDHFVDKEDGFRHSKWLSFMAKRLKLAKELLTDDGVILISIDDNEQSQLKLLCDEVFGENNFVGNLIWENKEGGGSSDSRHFRIKHEYLLVYGKNKEEMEIKGLDVKDQDRYKFSDEYEQERGKYQLIKLDSASLGYVKSLDYPIKASDGTKIYPNKNNEKISRWRWNKKKLKKGIEKNFVVIKKDKNDDWAVYTKQYLKVDRDWNLIDGRKIQPIGIISKYSTTQSNKYIKDLFKGEVVFKYSKPYEYIKYLIGLSSKKDDLILDFMAGSGTTGHAVLALNKEDGGNRKFILCTNNENKICENVTWERIKKVSKGYKKQNGDKVEGLGGSLKYLKTDFIKIDNNTDNLKEKTVEASTEILCLKENTFNEVVDDYKKHKIKIFENKNKYTAILFDLFYFDEFITELKKLKDRNVSIYVFSYTKDFSASEFGDLKIDFTVEAIPEKVLETYKKIFNF